MGFDLKDAWLCVPRFGLPDAFLAFGTSLGNHGLWIALLTFMVARGVVQGVFFWRRGLGLR